MNKTLDKLLSRVAKPVVKALIPLALTFTAYNADAQTIGDERRALNPPTVKGTITVVLDDEKSESLLVEEKVGYGTFAPRSTSSRHLDILKVYHPSSGDNYSFIYPEDLSWNVGDTLKFVICSHTDRDENGKRSRVWTDYELAKNYLGEDFTHAATPSKKRYHAAVVTEVKSIKSPKKD